MPYLTKVNEGPIIKKSFETRGNPHLYDPHYTQKAANDALMKQAGISTTQYDESAKSDESAPKVIPELERIALRTPLQNDSIMPGWIPSDFEIPEIEQDYYKIERI